LPQPQPSRRRHPAGAHAACRRHSERRSRPCCASVRQPQYRRLARRFPDAAGCRRQKWAGRFPRSDPKTHSPVNILLKANAALPPFAVRAMLWSRLAMPIWALAACRFSSAWRTSSAARRVSKEDSAELPAIVADSKAQTFQENPGWGTHLPYIRLPPCAI